MASRALSGLAEPDVRAMLASGPGPRLALQVFSWFQLCPVGGPWFSYFGLVSVASALRLLTPRPSSRPSVQSRTQLVVQPSSSPSGGFSCRLRGEGLWAKGRCCWQTCRGHFRRSGGFRLSAGQVVGFEVEGVSGRPVAAFRLRCFRRLACGVDRTTRFGVPGARGRGGRTRWSQPVRRAGGQGDCSSGSRRVCRGPELSRLRALVGPPPGRLGRAEAASQPTRAAEDALADEAAGVGQLEDDLNELITTATDPLHRVLASQTLLLQRLPEAGRHDHGSSPRRLGQRVRQFRGRRAGPFGLGGLHQAAGQSRGGRSGYPTECLYRAGFASGGRASGFDAGLAGETGGAFGVQDPGLLRDFPQLWVAGGQDLQQHPLGGLLREGSYGDRADDFGRWPARCWLAPHGVPGAPLEQLREAAAVDHHEAVFQPCSAVVGGRQSGVSQGPRLP